MTRYTVLGLIALCGMLAAADKKQPPGHGEDESVEIEASVLTPEQIKEAVGSDFAGVYTVLDVRITPKGGKPYDIHLDDFILRSESTGDHTGPFLAGQVAGSGALVVQRKYAARSNPEMPNMLDGMKVQMKDQLGTGDTLDAVKKRILNDQTTMQAKSGLMFFPMEKQKPKNLVLSCTTPQGKLRIQFK